LRAPKAAIPPPVLEALRALAELPRRSVSRAVGLKDLAPGMILDEDQRTAKGMRLVPSGQEVTASLLVRIRTVAGGVGIVEPFRVLVSV
jgi:hypothetical protein